MKNLSKTTLVFLKLIFRIILIGLLINIISILWVYISHYYHWTSVRKYFSSVNFTKIFNEDISAFNVILIGVFITTLLKIDFVNKIIKILKNLNLQNPFEDVFYSLIISISKISLIIGIINWLLHFYIEFSVKNELILSYQVTELNFLFLSALLYIIGQVYKKALYLKSENELTI